MDRRSVIGIVVCFIALALYIKFVAPKFAPKPQPDRSTATRPQPVSPSAVGAGSTAPSAAINAAGTAPGTTTVPVAATAPAGTLPAAAVAETVPPLDDKIGVETALFDVVLTNRGAAIKSVKAKDFLLTAGSDKPLPILTELEPGKTSLSIRSADGAGNLDTKIWECVENVPIPAGYSDIRQFRTRLGSEFEITKTYLFVEPKETGVEHPPDGRYIELRVDIRNLTAADRDFQYQIRTAAGIVPEPDLPGTPTPGWVHKPSRDTSAVIGRLAGDSVQLDTFSAGKSNEENSGGTVFGGAKNRYFVAVLRPVTEKAEVLRSIFEPVDKTNITTILEMQTDKIPANGTSPRTYQFLIAPKMPEVLNYYTAEHFDTLMKYGWPAPITRFLSWLLAKLWLVTHNYGWAIILLTLLVRIVLHPLSLKGQKSMFKMQKLQPLMAEIKEKYKHDKRIQQQETMKIMKEHGTPIGGCLPMLLQIPIFIGLWRGLYENVSLRQAPFGLWINDLSKADNLFNFGTSLPLVGQSFNLLPILCAAVMFVQQRMTPKNADPQQQQMQKMMMFMPIIFTFMLYTQPSGLMLYFFCSSLFGLIEQKYIRWHLDKISLAAPTASTSNAPVDNKRIVPAKKRR